MQEKVPDTFCVAFGGAVGASHARKVAPESAECEKRFLTPFLSLGVIRNSDLDIATGLPGSAYDTWNSQDVGFHDVLVKFTYTGDGNFDGIVSFDDYAAMDAAFFQTIAVLGWATGDVNNDGVINFDDYAAVDQAFFNQFGAL
jgi:hypothetical protein